MCKMNLRLSVWREHVFLRLMGFELNWAAQELDPQPSIYIGTLPFLLDSLFISLYSLTFCLAYENYMREKSTFLLNTLTVFKLTDIIDILLNSTCFIKGKQMLLDTLEVFYWFLPNCKHRKVIQKRKMYLHSFLHMWNYLFVCIIIIIFIFFKYITYCFPLWTVTC